MLAVYDDHQILHRPLTRIGGGTLKPNPEQPERVSMLLEGLQIFGASVIAPRDHGMGPIAATHDAGYLDFLENGFSAWSRIAGNGPEMRASVHPNIHMNRLPEDILGRTGYYHADASSVMLADTWSSVRASANSALDAMARLLEGETSIYALCRPPGHHAYADKAGGFCYLNNTAIAANLAAESGRRVAIIDVDVHHGNGTQTLFYARRDILTLSVHGDPAHLYPFYAGYADETGQGDGAGLNVNLPVPLMSGNDVYLDAVQAAVSRARTFAPDVVIIALGLDASSEDPFACMRVNESGFARMGRILAALKRPTLIVQEGGYPSPALATSLAAFLTGFSD